MVIAGIFVRNKDEQNIIEFMEHYYSLGFEFILILDDYSKIHPERIIKDKFNGKYKIIQTDISIINENLDNGNILFNKYILPEVLKYMDYCLYVDMDEYLVIKKYRNIIDIIDIYQPFDQLKINWIFFGTNNIKICQDLSNLKNLFTKSSLRFNNMVKSLVKVSSIISNICPHSFKVKGITKNILNEITNDSSSDNTLPSYTYKDVDIYIAHYITQDTSSFVKRCFARNRPYVNYYNNTIECDKHKHLILNETVQYINDKLHNIIDYVNGDNNDTTLFENKYLKYIHWMKAFFDSHNCNESDNHEILESHIYNVDWIHYIDSYPDLRICIHTEEQAMLHWFNFGKNEGRILYYMNHVGISLGNNCTATVFIVKNNLRKTKESGYNTCVFDLIVSNYNGVVKCILEDFNNFTNINYLKLNDFGDEKNKNIIINTYYNFCFNHETPGHADLFLTENWTEGKIHYINNEFFHFIERFNRRINNFKNYLQDNNNFITFIISFVNEPMPDDDCKDLRNALLLKYPTLKYKLLIM